MTRRYYQMGDMVKEGTTFLYKRSHRLVQLNSGHLLNDFIGPLICELDEEYIDGRMRTFYHSPGFIATTAFYNDLMELGIDCIQTFPVIINDEVNNREITDYLLLNVIGCVSCADMSKSEYKMIGDSLKDNMNIIDKLVIDSNKAGDLDLFLISEDTSCIVISERVYKHLSSKGYPDVWFEELEQV